MLHGLVSYYRPWRGLFWLDFESFILPGLLELAFPFTIMLFIGILLPRADLGADDPRRRRTLAGLRAQFWLMEVVIY